MTPVIVQMSGGVASWAAAMLAIEKYGAESVELLFADTLIEDEDLYRFLDDIEARGVRITRVAEGRDPWQVFFDKRFMGNTRVDPCSLVLKRELLRREIDARGESCIVVIGIDYTEAHRCERIIDGLRPHVAWFPLLDENIDKAGAFDMLAAAGIERPRLYDFGFAHNNCGGFCVKAGQAQFALLLHHLPERYAYHERREQEFREFIGKDVAILRDRRGGTTKPLTMTEFRRRIEESGEYDRDEWGGCGCALPGGEPSPLTLDLWSEVAASEEET